MLALGVCLSVSLALAQAPTGTLRGHVADPTGAVIPGASVTVTTVQGDAAGKATVDASGAYVVRGLAAGSYVVQVDSPGFAVYVSVPVALEAGQAKTLEIKMSVEGAQQQVEVTAEGAPQVSVEADNNANAVVLKGKDLDALSDDPDELSNELSALAGPSAGPNGGQIYIDGFTGGELPPKSAIREIRINQNPFSAEFDRLGYGRIEILTKPGTDKTNIRGFVQGNDSSFNTSNPFAADIPGYHSIQYNGTMSGPINKKASYFFSAEYRGNQNDTIYNATTAALVNGVYATSVESGGVFSPTGHLNISPRIDLQLGQKNTLTLRYQFFRNTATNSFGGGGFGGGFGSGGGASVALPSVATDSSTIEHQVQISDSEVINDHIVNETRFQYIYNTSNVSSLSGGPQISVPQEFTTGGSTSQNELDHTNRFELQNITTMTKGAHAIKFGTRLRDERDSNTTNNYFNGSFSFASLEDYVGALDHYNGITCPSYNAGTASSCGSANLPNKLTYYIGNQGALGNLFDGAVFIQDDWKKNKFLTLSGGLRWETENHIADHSDFGPRVALAYAIDGHKNGTQTKTVLRAGYGFFFDRLAIGSLMSATRYNGSANSMQQIVISNPTCFDPNSLASALAQGCSASTAKQQINAISRKYQSPSHEQAGASLERQLSKSATATITYLHTLGVHQNATIDANAYLPGTFQYGSTTLTGVRPNPGFGPIDEVFPEAIYKQDQVIFSVNTRVSQRFSVSGNYTLNWANSDTGTASNSSNISQDYGRAAFASRQSVFLMGNYTGPWAITFNPMMIAQAGRPFDITTDEDLTGDNFIGQDRPTWANPSNPNDEIVTTSYGSFNLNPQPGETVIPANIGNGPAAIAVNLRLSRAWAFGPETGGTAAAGGSGGRRGGQGGGGFGGIGMAGGMGGGRGGPGGGGPPPGGGGPFGGEGKSSRKYTFTFSAQALNVFNDIDYGTPTGTLMPGAAQSRFGKSTSLAGGIFSAGSAARRIFIQGAIQF